MGALLPEVKDHGRLSERRGDRDGVRRPAVTAIRCPCLGTTPLLLFPLISSRISSFPLEADPRDTAGVVADFCSKAGHTHSWVS